MITSFITDNQLAEGICAAAVWYIFWIYMRNNLNLPVYAETAIAWLLVWFVRKFGLSLYKSIKNTNKLPSFKIKLTPFPMITVDKPIK